MKVGKSILILLVLGLLAALAMPALAATTRARSISEEQINKSYRVTNPWRRAVSDVSVDLQPGQVVIYSTHTYRGGNAYAVATTAVPSVENGRIFWDVTSVMVDGSEISADLLAQINTWMEASWVNYMKRQNPGRVTAIEISEDAALVTYSAR